MLEEDTEFCLNEGIVSVAGCLGYDVLANILILFINVSSFQLLVV